MADGMPTLDEVLPETWRLMDTEQRVAFLRYWAEHGQASFCCLSCGFPTAHGQASCEACRPERG